MNGARISIPAAALAGFSKSTRDELLRYAGLVGVAGGASSNDGEASSSTVAASVVHEESGPPDFTVAMARKLIAQPISEKSTAILRKIAESPTANFCLKDIVAAAPEVQIPADLRGAWSGITRRARNILGDPDAEMIWWENEPRHDGDGNYVDHDGRVSALTHQSLRAAFGIRGND